MELEQSIFGENYVGNIRRLYLSRVAVLTLAGCVCGVLGYTGLHGVAFFFAVSAMVSVGWLLCINFQTETYFKGSKPVWTEGLGTAFTSFLLFWTIVYDMVHVF
eukprot:tig00021534_g22245.t1